MLSELEEIYPRVKVIVMLHIRTEKFYYVNITLVTTAALIQ